MHANGIVINLTQSNIRNMFEWLSSSVCITSSSTADVTVSENPTNFGMSWEQLSVNQ